MSLKKSIMSVLAIGVLGISILPVVPAAASSATDAKTEISANESSTDDLLKQIATANTENIKLDQQISTNSSKITEQETAIKDATTKIASLSGQINQAQQEVTKRTAVLKSQLVSLQKTSGDAVSGNVYIDFLLNSNDFADLVSRSMTVNKLNQASKTALADVNDAKSSLTTLKNDQESTKTTLVNTKASLETEKTNLTDLKAEASKKEAALNQKITDNKDQLEALQSKYDQANAEESAKAAAAKAAVVTAAKATTTTTTSESTPAAATPVTSNGSGTQSSSNSAGNSYAWGQCTWYVKSVASWAGNGWGNGNQWGASAAAEGFTVNYSPAAGAIVSFAGGQMVGSWAADGSYGHVAYVQSYNAASNTITITQGGMGFDSPGGPNTQTVSGASAFTYIHR